METYSRWLSEQQKEQTVLTLRDWLKEEVYIRVEATEMAQEWTQDPRKMREQDTGLSLEVITLEPRLLAEMLIIEIVVWRTHSLNLLV